MSIILRPKLDVKDASCITLKTAEKIRSVLTGLYQLSPEDFSIKEPNDILLHGKKVCGILTESVSKGNQIDYVVIGIGINLNSKPSEIVDGSISIHEELARKTEIREVLLSISDAMTDLLKL